ncbi:MAG: MaoC family dehydratase N-terminal domain-containing protein [Myxococcales bacterium]|jgi:acyl dehydratase|nr:MaoC family dehydratase N-terminal domain-containing protein [Myxococcales bacterium]
MRAQKKFDITRLQVGDELPSLTKPPIDRVQIAQWAGALNDFNPMNLDDACAQAEGMPGVFVNPQIPMAFVGELATLWRTGGHLKRQAVRFLKLVWPGDRLTFHGRLLRRDVSDASGESVEVDLWAENQNGEVILKGICVGALDAESRTQPRRKTQIAAPDRQP